MSDVRLPKYSDLRALTVLIIDGDAGDALFIFKMLASVKSVRFKILYASTLESAIEEFGWAADLLLLDMNHPDSPKILRYLRADAPSFPIIALTTIEHRRKGEEALAWGVKGCVIKEQTNGYRLAAMILRHIRLGLHGSVDKSPKCICERNAFRKISQR